MYDKYSRDFFNDNMKLYQIFDHAEYINIMGFSQDKYSIELIKTNMMLLDDTEYEKLLYDFYHLSTYLPYPFMRDLRTNLSIYWHPVMLILFLLSPFILYLIHFIIVKTLKLLTC